MFQNIVLYPNVIRKNWNKTKLDSGAYQKNYAREILIKECKIKTKAYLFRWIIIYTIVWYFTRSLHRKLDPCRNGILHTRWCIHPYLETTEKKNRGSFRLINLNISTPNQKIYLYTRAMRNSRGSISIIRQENLPSAILILKVISQYISMNMKNITYHVQIYLYAMKPINLFHNKILWMGYHKNSKNVL